MIGQQQHTGLVGFEDQQGAAPEGVCGPLQIREVRHPGNAVHDASFMSSWFADGVSRPSRIALAHVITRSAGLLDRLCLTTRPTGNVGEAVLARIEAQRVAHDVGDGLDLDLCHLTPRRKVFTMQESVTELVDQRLDGLRRLDVGTNGDLLVEEIAVAVLTPPLISDDLVSGGFGLGDEHFPDAGRGITVEQLGTNGVEVGKVFALGLRDVEDVDDPEATDLLEALLVTVVVFDFGLVLARSEDGDALLLCG